MGIVIPIMTNWIKDCFWSWANAIYFRFDKYEYDIDRCAFFEELGRDTYYTYMMNK